MIKRTAKGLKNAAGFFISVANAFNPFYYRGISNTSFSQVIAYLLYLLLLVTLAAGALVAPSIVERGGEISSQLDSLSKISIKTELTTSEPIEEKISWLNNAKVFINTTADEKTKEKNDLIITNSEVLAKPILCLYGKEICSILHVKPHATQIKELNSKDWKTEIIATILIMLPGILILAYLSLLIKYAVISIVAGIVFYIAARIINTDTGIIDSFKTAAYATTILVVIDFAIVILGQGRIALPGFISIAAYLVILVAAMAVSRRGGDGILGG